jgi:hypothetical protein
VVERADLHALGARHRDTPLVREVALMLVNNGERSPCAVARHHAIDGVRLMLQRGQPSSLSVHGATDMI